MLIVICRMRILFKEPIYEYFPYDNMNAVSLIYKITASSFKLAAPYPVTKMPISVVLIFLSYSGLRECASLFFAHPDDSYLL